MFKYNSLIFCDYVSTTQPGLEEQFCSLRSEPHKTSHLRIISLYHCCFSSSMVPLSPCSTNCDVDVLLFNFCPIGSVDTEPLTLPCLSLFLIGGSSSPFCSLSNRGVAGSEQVLPSPRALHSSLRCFMRRFWNHIFTWRSESSR